METIKSVSTSFFEIKLVQGRSGIYYVAYGTKEDAEPTVTEGMQDLNTAMSVFDVILREMQGH